MAVARIPFRTEARSKRRGLRNGDGEVKERRAAFGDDGGGGGLKYFFHGDLLSS